MSATGRPPRLGGEHDFYETPEWATALFIEAIRCQCREPDPGLPWLEPAAGSGAIVRGVQRVVPGALFATLDIRGEAGARRTVDYLSEPFPGFGAVITNPPYSLAFEFAQKAVTEAPWVAMLLRLGFLEGHERNAWLRDHPPSLYVLANRPTFAGGKCDSAAYAWFLWDRGPASVYVLPWLTKSERASFSFGRV